MTGRKPTLIVMRRTRAESNIAFATVTSVFSFARFKSSMAASNVERVPFGCRDVATIVKTCSSQEETVR